MAKLKKRHKEYIVRQLACFELPSDIVGQLKKQFNLTVSFAQIAYYNPDNSQGGRELARKWRHLFNETRDQFIDDSAQIPIAHKNYRLNQLQKIYQKLVGKGKLMEACKVLEQAAKETGGAYGGNHIINPSAKNGNFYQQVNQKIIQLSKN